MKRLAVMCLGIMLVAAGYSVCAQSPEEREREEKLRREAAYAEIQRQELVNLQKETGRALQLHNSSFFGRIYSDDFLGTSPTGDTLDKTALIKAVETSTSRYSTFVVTDIRVRIFQSTAVVSCLWSSRGTENGVAFFRQSRVLNIYVYGPQGWRTVASQETQLPG